MPGPQEQKLIQALHGSAPGNLDGRADEWLACAEILGGIAAQLRTARLPIQDGDAGAKTAQAMNEAFGKSAEAMLKRAAHLREGKGALNLASQALDTATTEHANLGPEGSAPTYSPHEDPGSEAGIKAHNKYLSALGDFQAKQQHREEVARHQNEKLDEAFTKAQTTMKEIHGEKPPPPPPPSYGSTGGSGGSAPGSPGSPRHSYTISSPQPQVDHFGTVHPEPADGGGEHGTQYTPGGGHVGDPGTPGGPGGSGVVPAAAIGDLGAPGASSGVGVGGAVGLGAGGAAAGLIGAKLTGALRGGLFGGAPVSASGVAPRGTATSAVRGIGSSARAAGASTLGRGTSAASGTAGRSAGAARSGAGATGRSGAGAGAGRSGGTGRSGSGATGRSGSGSRAGAGASGRGGRSKDDKSAGKHEIFDVGEDWVGDDDAAPGVLD